MQSRCDSEEIELERIVDVTPLLQDEVAIRNDQISKDWFHPRLYSSARDIQSAASNLSSFTRQRLLRKARKLSLMGVTLTICYLSYCYAAIKFLSQDSNDLIKYNDIPTNGNTCGKAFPINEKLCNYIIPRAIPYKASLALYCASILNSVDAEQSSYYYANFLELNCYDFFTNINLANLTSMASAILDCMKHASSHYAYCLTYDDYLKYESLINGTPILCQTILPFANSSLYDAFSNGRGGDCQNYAAIVIQIFSNAKAQYESMLGGIGSCESRFPIMATYNFSAPLENLYRIIPDLKPCFNYANKCMSYEYEHADIRRWFNPTRIILLGLGLMIAVVLYQLTCKFYKDSKKVVNETDHFGDLPPTVQEEINEVVQTFSEKNTPAISSDKTIEESKQILLNADSDNNRRLEKAREVIAIPSLFGLFSKAGSGVTAMVLENADLMRVKKQQQV